MTDLDDAVAKHVTAEDLGQIVSAFVEKAKTGNVHAANFVLKLIVSETPQTVVNNHFYESGPEDDRRVIDVPVTPRPITTAESVTVYLSAAGAATAESIAEQTGNAVDDVIRVLDSNPDRYDVRGSLYSLNKKYLTRS